MHPPEADSRGVLQARELPQVSVAQVPAEGGCDRAPTEAAQDSGELPEVDLGRNCRVLPNSKTIRDLALYGAHPRPIEQCLSRTDDSTPALRSVA